MAKIINFGSKLNNEGKEKKRPGVRVDYRDKIRSHHFTVFYRVSLGLVLALAILLVGYLQWKHHTYSECVVVSSVEHLSVEGSVLKELDGKVVAYSKDGVNCFDRKGESIWNVTYEMKDPIVKTAGSMVAIADPGSQVVYVMDNTGTIGEITTSMPIYNFAIAENGSVAVVLDDSDVTWIYLYDRNGTVISYFKTTMQQSGFPVDLAISPNGVLVGVSYLYVNSGEVRGRVGFFNFGPVGQNSVDNYVGNYDYPGSVVPLIAFMNSKTAYAVVDDRIVFYTGDQKPVMLVGRMAESEIKSVFSNDEYVAVVMDSSDPESRYKLVVYNRNGDETLSKDFDLDYTDITFGSNAVYIYNESRGMIYDMDGLLKYQGNFGKSAGLLIPGDRMGKMTVVSHESLDELQLQ